MNKQQISWTCSAGLFWGAVGFLYGESTHVSPVLTATVLAVSTVVSRVWNTYVFKSTYQFGIKDVKAKSDLNQLLLDGITILALKYFKLIGMRGTLICAGLASINFITRMNMKSLPNGLISDLLTGLLRWNRYDD